MNYKEFFSKAKEKGIDNIQITSTTVESVEIEFINENLENYINTNHTSYAIKAEKDKKTEKLVSDYLDEDIIETLLMKINNTDTNYEDEYLPKKEIRQEKLKVEVDTDKEYEIIKNIYKLKDKDKRISKITTAYEDSYVKTQIINSNGANLETTSHNYFLYTDILIEANGENISYDKQILKTNKDEINFEEFVNNTIDEALLMTNKENLETKKYNVVLSSKVASRIISHIVDMINATSIRTKTSCMCEKINKQIFSKDITIIEDPANELYPGFRLFDDEGTITNKKTIIENGTLKTYLSNIKEAKINNTTSTGNSFSNGISVRNMYLLPSNKSLEEILKETKDGIYITDYMGASNTSISATTGNISIQVFGLIIENGKIKNGFTPCILTTTIFELLNNVKFIGNNLEFTNNKVASPVISIKDISIAGNK